MQTKNLSISFCMTRYEADENMFHTGMDDESASVVAMRSCDGVEAAVSELAAQQSALLRVYLENVDDSPSTCLHLDNVDGRTLTFVCKFMSYYAKSPYTPVQHPIQTSSLRDLYSQTSGMQGLICRKRLKTQ